MIIYFTATKNSKYIAELMATRLEDEAIDAAALIKSGEKPTFESKKPYIFVFPIYAWRMPRVFKKWIKECKFVGTKKAYFVVTCGDIAKGQCHRIDNPECSCDSGCHDIYFFVSGDLKCTNIKNYIR